MSNAPLPRFVSTFVFIGFLGFVAAPASAAPFVITPNLTAAQMVALLVGPGITVVPGSERYNGSAVLTNGASGSFTGGAGIIPFDAGIILTSGAATGAAGPNSVGNFSTFIGTGADPDLNALVSATTFDRSVLEFDFTSASNNVTFQYVFASEEYDEFVGSTFNDVFAFFLNGSNIALLPGTNTAVAINTVNCGTNQSFYTGNNDDAGGTFGSCGDAGLNTQYDGLAGASSNPLFQLFVTGPLLPGGAINHIKLAIADTSDGSWDSAVFLRASSFTPPTNGQLPIPNQPVPEPATLALLGSGLLLALRARRRSSV